MDLPNHLNLVQRADALGIHYRERRHRCEHLQFKYGTEVQMLLQHITRHLEILIDTHPTFDLQRAQEMAYTVSP